MKLTKLPSVRTSWKTWKKRNPKTLVLSTDTGYQRNYDRDPYKGYYRVGTIWFPVGKVRKDLSPKEQVLGIEIEGVAKAYPLTLLQKSPGLVKDTVNGKEISIEVTAEGEIVAVRDDEGKTLTRLFSYWFAWQAFHPQTTVFTKE